MKKYILDLTVTENIRLHANYVLIKLTQSAPLPDMLPGQFAEIRIDGSNTTFLRRPISINYVDRKTNEVWFLVQLVGDGTRKLATVKEGDILAEIETDKATMEFESFYAGTLLYIGIKEGESAPIDSLLAIIGPAGTDVNAVLAAAKGGASAAPAAR